MEENQQGLQDALMANLRRPVVVSLEEWRAVLQKFHQDPLIRAAETGRDLVAKDAWETESLGPKGPARKKGCSLAGVKKPMKRRGHGWSRKKTRKTSKEEPSGKVKETPKN